MAIDDAFDQAAQLAAPIVVWPHPYRLAVFVIGFEHVGDLLRGDPTLRLANIR